MVNLFKLSQMPGVVVHSVYIPQNERFVLPALGYGHLPHIVIEDSTVAHRDIPPGQWKSG